MRSPETYGDKFLASPGFGQADSADGKRFPYIFRWPPVLVARGCGHEVCLDDWKKAGKQPKI
jgi:hypothetical protein